MRLLGLVLELPQLDDPVILSQHHGLLAIAVVEPFDGRDLLGNVT